MKHELKAKTIWIRDELEPYVARNGPRFLSPDTVLDLNAFLISLRQQLPHLTLEAVLFSRVHKALLLISGRGTRWPSKLIEVSDALITEMTARFGSLDMLRPALYEKGGRLEAFADERHLGRHGLIMKWLSDPTSLVSPLNAHEYGHLGFKPGQWWVHPVFAFHDGIIDSPDPLGGITADQEGAYAILLTNSDESSFNNADYFTYRCHAKDKGKFRLMNAILPPKQSIRVLRSHTLRSPFAPAAGVRYEGLYKIVSYGMHLVRGETAWDISLRRDIDQISMREVELHPKAEEVDDYVEYKRLREARQVTYEEETSNLSPVGHLYQPSDSAYTEQSNPHPLPPGVSTERLSKNASNILRHTPNHFDNNTVNVTSPIRAEAHEQETPQPAIASVPGISPRVLDGTFDFANQQIHSRNVVEECSPRSSVRQDRLDARSVLPAAQPPLEHVEARKDSAWSNTSKNNESLLGDSPESRRVSVTEQSSIVEHLATTLGELKIVTMHKGQMSRRFSNDLQHFAKMVQQIRLETHKMAKALPAASDAIDIDNEIELDYLQHCLRCLEDDLKVTREMVTAVPTRKQGALMASKDLNLPLEVPLESATAEDSSDLPKGFEIDSDDDVMTEALQNFQVRYSIDGVVASSERQLVEDDMKGETEQI